MSFRNKPAYTNEELNDAVTRIERLTVLMEKAEKMARMTTNPAYQESYERLTANIKTSQILYQKMLEKLNGTEK